MQLNWTNPSLVHSCCRNLFVLTQTPETPHFCIFTNITLQYCSVKIIISPYSSYIMALLMNYDITDFSCGPVKHLVLFQLHDHVDFKCNIIVYTSQGLYYTARWKQFYRQWITCEKAIVTIHVCYKHFALHKPVWGQKVVFHFCADCTSLNQVDTVWFLLDRAMLNGPKVQLWHKALYYSSFLDS